MGFFKDFKDDLSETVNGLSEQESEQAAGLEDTDDLLVNTLDDPELAKMSEDLKKEAAVTEEDSSITDKLEEQLNEQTKSEVEETAEETVTSDVNVELPTSEDEEAIADETAVITAGLTVTGNLDSTGSIDLFGTVEGNVSCRGKLTVNGSVTGDSKANEIFANNAQIDGNVEAKGSVKIGQGTVIVGNITATSAVIAGAVKGDIDVKGPVIVDTSAVIVGDIKSKTVQINNGATIDGRCSQCYADVDMDALFDMKHKKNK